MPQDLFTVKKTVTELNNLIVGAKVNKILQPDNNEINLVIYNGKTAKLIVSAHAKFARVSISNAEKPNPETPFNFCMLLRKHLLGSVITAVEIAGDDRIIKISFQNKNDFFEEENLQLYAEIMGKYSNIFLVKNGAILGAIKKLYGVESNRLTLIGANYVLPDKGDKISILSPKAEQVFCLYNDNVDLSKFIMANFYDFSPVTAREIAQRITDNNPQFNPRKAYETAMEFAKSKLLPIVVDDGVKKDFYATDYVTVSGKRKYFNLMVEAIEYVFENQESESFLQGKKSSLYQKINSLEKKLTKRLCSLKEKVLQSKNYEKLKLFGELLTSQIYLVKKGQTIATLTNYTDSGEEMVEVMLDSQLSPQQNAQKYFKAYRKNKTAVELSKQQIDTTEQELNYLLGVKFHLDTAETIDDILDVKEELILSKIIVDNVPTKKKKQRKPLGYKRYKINGFEVMLGKNNVQNDYILGVADKQDLWLHTKNYHSCHVIIKTMSKTVDYNTITACAEICAFYSQGNGGGKIEVDYTFRKNVKKQGGDKIGSVYYQNQKTITVTPNSHNEYIIK